MLTWHKYPDKKPTTNKEVLVRTDENTYKICRFMKTRNTFDTYFIVTHWAEFNRPEVEEEPKKRGRKKCIT